MKLSLKIITTLFLFSQVNSQLLAQKYTEGMFEMGLISLESTMMELDSSMEAILRSGIEKDMAFTIYFAPGKATKISKEESRQKTVYDFENKKLFVFQEIAGTEGYMMEDIPNAIQEFDKDSLQIEFLEDLEMFGLACKKHKFEYQGTEMIVVTTNDIEYLDVLGANPIGKDLGALVSMGTAIPDLGVNFVIGLTSFTPSISDHSIFEVDTLGKTNFNAFNELFQEDIEEEEAVESKK